MATKRGYYREELERAISNIEMALTHLVRVIEAYQGPHPEIAEQVLSAGEGLEMAGEIIKKVHEQI